MQNSTNMRILELLRFLYERTDENHPATVSDIIAHLNGKGIQAVRQTREAMRTRGAGGLLNPAILYRAFLIPLMVRLVNLSDTLALSVETRGFTTYPAPYTVYRPVHLQARDGAFAALSALCAMGAVLL